MVLRCASLSARLSSTTDARSRPRPSLSVCLSAPSYLARLYGSPCVFGVGVCREWGEGEGRRALKTRGREKGARRRRLWRRPRPTHPGQSQGVSFCTHTGRERAHGAEEGRRARAPKDTRSRTHARKKNPPPLPSSSPPPLLSFRLPCALTSSSCPSPRRRSPSIPGPGAGVGTGCGRDAGGRRGGGRGPVAAADLAAARFCFFFGDAACSGEAAAGGPVGAQEPAAHRVSVRHLPWNSSEQVRPPHGVH